MNIICTHNSNADANLLTYEINVIFRSRRNCIWVYQALFVATGRTGDLSYDSIGCHRWRQSCHNDDSWFELKILTYPRTRKCFSHHCPFVKGTQRWLGESPQIDKYMMTTCNGTFPRYWFLWGESTGYRFHNIMVCVTHILFILYNVSWCSVLITSYHTS